MATCLPTKSYITTDLGTFEVVKTENSIDGKKYYVKTSDGSEAFFFEWQLNQ